jgi:hypothetical protein
MAVKPETLRTPEDGLDLQDREARGAKKVNEDQVRLLSALRERLAAAKAANPQAHDDSPHCSDCFRRGWEAGVRAVEGEQG